ncbi:Hypothetical predicted protein [Marmota monax]|uniref:Uncharacterized protein n=1 Tax=Marmota monax TaxID=9995 RepID=A0A5E4C917_MARMO|nr:Hypothetical predicted protein [Marmota monax]
MWPPKSSFPAPLFSVASIASYSDFVPGCELSGDKESPSCLELCEVCPSLHRMSERAVQNWNAGHWLLALCLTWLWTLLASASSQPPTATGQKVFCRERGPRVGA